MSMKTFGLLELTRETSIGYTVIVKLGLFIIYIFYCGNINNLDNILYICVFYFIVNILCK